MCSLGLSLFQTKVAAEFPFDHKMFTKKGDAGYSINIKAASRSIYLCQTNCTVAVVGKDTIITLDHRSGSVTALKITDQSPSREI